MYSVEMYSGERPDDNQAYVCYLHVLPVRMCSKAVQFPNSWTDIEKTLDAKYADSHRMNGSRIYRTFSGS